MQIIDTFGEYLKRTRIHSITPAYSNAILSEGIIIPNMMTVNTLDVEKLNNDSNMKELNIEFVDNVEGGWYREGKIIIGMIGIESKQQLSSLIGHELIHAIQDEKSKSKFMNFAKVLDSKLQKSKDIESFKHKLDKNDFKINFDNPYEKMAYAYQFVSEYKSVINKSIEDLIEFIYDAYPEFNKDKKFLKYTYQFYEKLGDT